MKEKISVNIYPTRTIIRDIPESYEKSIQKSLSVWNKVTFSYSFYAYKEELNEEDEDEATYNLIVPSGYNLKRIIASLSNSTLSKVIVNDYRLDYLNEEKTRKKKFKKVTNFSEPKDDIQKRTLNYLNNNHHSNKGCQKFVALKTGKGKAQPINTIIPTPNGYKKFGDLKIGDLVFNRYGKPVKVTGVFPKGQLKNYKVTLDDGRVTYCNDDHLWNVRYQTVDPKTKKTIYKEKTITLKEMIKKGIYKGPRNTYRYSIPINKPVEYIEQTLPIHPYVLGALIGNGCFTERAVSISSNDEFVVNKIGKLLNLKPIKQHESNYSWYFELETPTNRKRYLQNNEFLINENFNLTNLKSKDKFIPDLYKISSLEQRINLLQGLFDTDGYISIKDKRNSLTCNYTTVSKQLANDVCEILRSIGISCSISKDTHKDYKNEENCCYTVNIRCENKDKVQLFSLPRKKNIAIKYMNCKIRKDYNYIAIVSIEKMKETEEMQCIMVDDEEHLYLTNNYIVTHNTFCAIKYITDNNERPIIFVDQDSLGKQWIEKIREYTNTTSREIYFISGKPSIDKLMKMSDEDILNIKFFVCCYRTISNILKNDEIELFKLLFEKLNVTVKVYDEAHIEYMSMVNIDLNTDFKSLYLSATPHRTDPIEDKVYQNIFHDVDIWSNKVANNWKEDELYHYIFIYKWNSKPSMIEETTCSTKYGFSLAKYCNYLLEKRYDDFFNILTEILFNVIKINTKKRKTAILFGTINLLEKFNDDLSSYINDEYKDEDIKIGIFNGKVNKDDKLKILNDSDIILTTDKSFSKGMDAPNLEVVVNTVPFSSEVKLEQTVGRLRPLKDKKVIFLDINDTGFKGITYQLKNKTEKTFSKLAKKIFVYEKKSK